jgi:hypothetical protein
MLPQTRERFRASLLDFAPATDDNALQPTKLLTPADSANCPRGRGKGALRLQCTTSLDAGPRRASAGPPASRP